MIIRSTCLMLLLLSLTSPAAAEPSSLLVSPHWLQERLQQPGVVVLHVGDRKEYDTSHIPGARFISLQEISEPGAKLRLQMADVTRLRETFEALGISNNSQVVLYWGSDSVTPTARVFLALEYLGLGSRTSILDGGLPAWSAEQRPVTADVPAAARGTITPEVRAGAVVDLEWVRSRLNTPGVVIVDARDRTFYTGENDGRGTIPRPGHIAGAVSVPFSQLLEEKPLKFKPVEALRALFSSAGVNDGSDVVVYCHIGQQASAVYFAARLLGMNARVYDGSFEEWSARPDLPVVR